MKAVMDRNEGDGELSNKPIVLGEYGFSTAATHQAPPVPDWRRAYYLKRAVATADAMPY
jgi:hypothetical protein